MVNSRRLPCPSQIGAEVPFVRTADNIADFFTKPMKSANQFHAFRKTIMNEL